MKRNTSRKGFTLIEILIVTGIIAVLATVILVAGDKAREEARDSKRIADLNQIELALEAYFNNPSSTGGQQYPSSLGQLVTTGFIDSAPTDPESGTQYDYLPNATQSGFCLGTVLEIPVDGANKQSANCNTNNPKDNYEVSR